MGLPAAPKGFSFAFFAVADEYGALVRCHGGGGCGWMTGLEAGLGSVVDWGRGGWYGM